MFLVTSKRRDRTTYPWVRRRRKLLFALAIPLILAALLLTYRLRLRNRAEEALASLEAMGVPISSEAFAAWHPYPEGENAATVYTEAIASIQPLNPTRAAGLPYLSGDSEYALNQPYAEEALQTASEILTENAEALDLAHRAGLIPQSRYPIDYDTNARAIGGIMSQAEALAKLLALHAAVAADTAREEACVDALVDFLRYGASFRNEPSTFVHYRRGQLNAIFADTLSRVLSRTSLSEAQLRRLENAVVEAEAPEGFHRAVVGEVRGLVLMMTREEAMPLEGPVATVFSLLGVQDGAICTIAKAASVQIEATRGNYEQAVAAGRKLERWAEDASWAQRNLHIFYWGLSQHGYRHFWDLALLRACRLAIAAERYRLVKGGLPENTEDLAAFLGDAMPEDPFSHEAMRYRREADGYATYSVGRFPDEAESLVAEAESNGTSHGKEVPFVRVVTPTATN